MNGIIPLRKGYRDGVCVLQSKALDDLIQIGVLINEDLVAMTSYMHA